MQNLTELNVWHDSTPRSGAMNMAIDHLLLENIANLPILRFYTWDRPTVSFGYFGTLATAKATFNGKKLDFIRRWTGGGIVDHRIDLTYSLVIPYSHPWARLRGAESYHFIHQAVAEAFNQTSTICKLNTKDKIDGSEACFNNPVVYDIITTSGEKLAGAGQKHTRYGLLHQGSVINITNTCEWKKSFTHFLTKSSIPWEPDLSFFDFANNLVKTRYGTNQWLEKNSQR